MSTSRRTWKNAESELAELFGCKRRPLSGSSGRADLDSSDSTHPTLYLEAKLRAAHPIWTLRDSCKKKAAQRSKCTECDGTGTIRANRGDVSCLKCAGTGKMKIDRPIVLGIKRKGSPGMMICVHTEDLDQMLEERRKTLYWNENPE